MLILDLAMVCPVCPVCPQESPSRRPIRALAFLGRSLSRSQFFKAYGSPQPPGMPYLWEALGDPRVNEDDHT